jgi:hypothetical protein
MDKAQTSTTTPQWKRGILPCTILGCIDVLIIEKLDASGIEAAMSLGIAAFTFFLTALVVGRLYGAASGFNILSIGLGIAVGTFLGAVIDPTHNLWPIAIVIFWIVGAIPVALGVLLGTFWRTRSARRFAG